MKFCKKKKKKSKAEIPNYEIIFVCGICLVFKLIVTQNWNPKLDIDILI